MTNEQQQTFESLMKLNNINIAADAIVNVCNTFNMSIEQVMSIIIARAEIISKEHK